MEMEWISVDIWINHGYGYQWIPWIYDINMDSIGFIYIYIYMLYTYIYIYGYDISVDHGFIWAPAF